MGLTQFDILVIALLGMSALVGFVRGAVREVMAVVALLAAAALAVFGLPIFAPILRSFIRPDWLGTGAALVGIFLIAFIALRLLGGVIAQQAQSTLGFLDRSLGLMIGLGRGLIVLGALFLLFDAATPQDLRPRWITGARTWPVARSMGRFIQSLTPQGLNIAGRLKPAFDRAIREGSGDKTATDGYEAREPRRPETNR